MPAGTYAAKIADALVLAVLVGAAACVAGSASAQYAQQGPLLIGSGGTTATQGNAVTISADGNTAVVGGLGDGGHTGAVWVYIRSGGVWGQQGPKLVGSGAIGNAEQGASVSLSADGNTLIEGGPFDDNSIGAAWIFTRSAGVWTQQAKLIGSDYNGGPEQGTSVALSGDGNTAIIGGPNDTPDLGYMGAAWVFTQSGGVWTQQGNKLVGNGNAGGAEQGWSVALSSDGNTALVGGPFDDDIDQYGTIGAAWVFTRSNGAWAQQGSKLVGTGVDGYPNQGSAVSLSADGNTALLGGPLDNSGVGAGWIFTQSAGTWSQQAKLVGSNNVGNSNAGWSVALSGDGNTAMIGGVGDNNTEGAVWAFANSGGVWSQVGSKLVGKYAGSGTELGTSVALSGTGQTAIIGGPFEPLYGAAWVFVTPPSLALFTNTHDFNGDGVSDILWRQNGSGALAMWLMGGGQLSSGATIGQVTTNWSVVGTRDFNGDGDADILWLDNAGDLAVWLMNGATFSSGVSLGNVGTQWSVAGTGDFNHDGTGDILWRNTSTGAVAIWLMSGGVLSSGIDLGAVPSTWQIAGTGDFNGNGTTDILWRDQSTGDLAIWLLSNGQFSSGADLGTVPLTWTVVGTGDFNGDGTTDILWRDSSGNLAIWLISNGTFSSGAAIAQVPTTWSVAETGDFDGNGTSDILWLDTSGDLAVWLMNGASISSGISLGNIGISWQVQGQNAD